MESFKYTSLHQYLDCALKNNPNTSHAEVKEAKREYWKLYYTYYRKEKRTSRKEFTLGFYPNQLQQIHLKRGSQTVSKFLYEAINRELKLEKEMAFDAETLSEIHLQLMQLISLVEELLDTEVLEEITQVLERLEVLETSFSQILNP